MAVPAQHLVWACGGVNQRALRVLAALCVLFCPSGLSAHELGPSAWSSTTHATCPLLREIVWLRGILLCSGCRFILDGEQFLASVCPCFCPRGAHECGVRHTPCVTV